MKLSGSLVLFHNDPNHYSIAIQSFLEGCDGPLFVVDNSLEPLQHDLFASPRVRYLYSGENLGFGKAHNLAIAMSETRSDAHLVLNPDVSFESKVLPELFSFLESNKNVGAVMPRINYPDGSLQYLCKLLPTPLDLISRRFMPFDGVKVKINDRYELRQLSQELPSIVPSLSGCFLMFRTELFKKIGGFDEQFFMYMEDIDLVRRIGVLADTVYLPSVNVKHCYAKGSYKNWKLLRYHIRSAVRYFNKWGWLHDRYRSDCNHKALTALKLQNKSVRHL